MITKITEALAHRRDALKGGENDKGFTLIELMVVVIIIGILAAIAIPAFLGQQNSAKDSAVASDLSNAKLALVGYASAKGTYLNGSSQLTGTDLKNYGFVSSTGTDPTVFADSTGAYCISEQSKTQTWFKIVNTSNTVASTSGACSSVTG